MIENKEQKTFDFNKAIKKNNEISNKLNKNTILGENLINLTNAIVESFNKSNEYISKVLDMGTKLFENLSASLEAPTWISKISNAVVPIYYLDLLKRLKWPLFLVDSEELQANIMSACKTGDNIEAVRIIVEDYFSDEVISAFEKDWISCEMLSGERKPILKEALLMHKSGYYYSSVSILMCQLYGVGADIVALTHKKGLRLDDSRRDSFVTRFGLKKKYIDSDKGKIFQAVMFTESGHLVWNNMVDYLKNISFSSSDSVLHNEIQPMRHKVAHGKQLNFGTKEHSIKAILVVDMLIQLLYHLEGVESLPVE